MIDFFTFSEYNCKCEIKKLEKGGIIIIEINLKKLRLLRLQNEKTERELAEMLSIATNTYHNKEKGQRAIKLEEAKKLADYYNVSIEELFFKV